MAEIWKPITGYENRYEASNLGRVRSVRRKTILRAHTNSDGYSKVILFSGARQEGGRCAPGKCISVHRAMWLAFYGPIPAGMEVDHVDNVATNNRLENLQLLSPEENKKKQWANMRAKGARRSFVSEV